jgi:CheY-like chemotaxis protein
MNSLVRILLVEDDPSDVILVRAALRRLNLDDQMQVVNDGPQALDFLFSRGAFKNRPPGQPAVVLLDLKLPLLDGFQVLECIRSDPARSLIPVVILTSSQLERDVRRAYSLGANGYVLKTIDHEGSYTALCSLGHYWAFTNISPMAALPANGPTNAS